MFEMLEPSLGVILYNSWKSHQGQLLCESETLRRFRPDSFICVWVMMILHILTIPANRDSDHVEVSKSQEDQEEVLLL